MTKRTRSAAILALAGALAVTATAGLPAAAAAPTAPSGVVAPRLAFRCTLAVTDLGESMRVVYRLSSDGPRQRWRLRMWDNGVRIYRGLVRTDADGRFRVLVITGDREGPDRLRARARHLATGRICAVRLTA